MKINFRDKNLRKKYIDLEKILEIYFSKDLTKLIFTYVSFYENLDLISKINLSNEKKCLEIIANKKHIYANNVDFESKSIIRKLNFLDLLENKPLIEFKYNASSCVSMAYLDDHMFCISSFRVDIIRLANFDNTNTIKIDYKIKDSTFNDKNLFLLDNNNNIYIVNEPMTFSRKKIFTNNCNITSICAENDFLYAVDTDNKLIKIYDINNKNELIDTILIYIDFSIFEHSIHLTSDYIYFKISNRVLVINKISREIDFTYRLEALNYGFNVNDDYLFTTDRLNLYIYKKR